MPTEPPNNMPTDTPVPPRPPDDITSGNYDIGWYWGGGNSGLFIYAQGDGWEWHSVYGWAYFDSSGWTWHNNEWIYKWRWEY